MDMTDTNELTATAAAVLPEPITPGMELLQKELMKLTIEALTELLERFSFDVKPGLSKKELVGAVLELESRRINESREETAKAVEETSDPDDPMITMTFQNLESPGADLMFTYQKGGFKPSPNGKVKPAPRWHFLHGHTYTIPYSVVQHLQSLSVPVDRPVQTDGEGMIRSLYSQDKQKRFACQVELSPEQVRSLTKG